MHLLQGWIKIKFWRYLQMTKYLIDASIIASSMEDFKRRFCSSESILILSDLTFKELEDRIIDRNCMTESRKFVRFLIDLFVRDTTSTEVCVIDSEISSKHIDQELVKYAKDNSLCILTCDKGMALWCRFYNVECKLLEVRSTAKLSFVHENNESVHINLRHVPGGSSTFVYSPEKNKIISATSNDIIFLNPGYIVLVAHHSTENDACNMDTYYVDKELDLNLICKDIYFSEDDIDVEGNPFHLPLYQKWLKHSIKK